MVSIEALERNVLRQNAERAEPTFPMPHLPLNDNFELEDMENSLLEKAFKQEFVSINLSFTSLS